MALSGVALGGNLGQREENLCTGIERIRELGTIRSVSSFYDTAPVGVADQPRFLNAALLLETALAPLELLDALLAIEAALGRDRAAVAPKGPRTLDLDLLFYGDLILKTAALVLPHPALHERRFVLMPLAEIAPGWRHPGLRRTVEELLQSLP